MYENHERSWGGSIDLTLTDIPYGSVNRKDNGLRNLNKGNADIETFNLQEFLKEVDRVTAGTIIIFCGVNQVSEYLLVNTAL